MNKTLEQMREENKAMFMEKLKPFLEVVDRPAEDDEIVQGVLAAALESQYLAAERKTAITAEKVAENVQVKAAMLLRALYDSWASYDTPITLSQEGLLSFFDSPERIKASMHYLETLGLIERQGRRMRLNGSTKFMIETIIGDSNK